MKCQSCGSEYAEGDYRCPNCNKIVATNPDDFKKADPRAWTLVGVAFLLIGILGMVFVYLNRERPAFSNQDYYSGAVLALAGLGVIIYSRMRGK
jgi:uncharacterized membrane protein YvbJ